MSLKKFTTSDRLHQIMNEKNLRQIDILNMTLPYCKEFGVKMNKSDISQYVSGKVEPNQDKLAILGMALNVNEAWLMGYDAPAKRKRLSSDEAKNDFELIEKFSMLSDSDKTLVISLINSLLEKAGLI
jgi:transcriptional regulator with XRE-family HTH domain